MKIASYTFYSRRTHHRAPGARIIEILNWERDFPVDGMLGCWRVGSMTFEISYGGFESEVERKGWHRD